MSDSLRDDELVATYRATIRPLYAYVSRRVGGDRPLAEDLVQDVWMRAIGAWTSRGLPRDPLAWLLASAHNAIVSHFRRIRPEAIDPASIDLEAPAFSTDASDAAALVSWALARIRRRDAELLEAFYFDNQSIRELAVSRRLTERAVEGRLRRARLSLKRVLDRLPHAPASSAGTTQRSPEHVG